MKEVAPETLALTILDIGFAQERLDLLLLNP
jgi:hypothetical protein